MDRSSVGRVPAFKRGAAGSSPVGPFSSKSWPYSSVRVERHPVTVEVASSSLVRVAKTHIAWWRNPYAGACRRQAHQGLGW